MAGLVIVFTAPVFTFGVLYLLGLTFLYGMPLARHRAAEKAEALLRPAS